MWPSSPHSAGPGRRPRLAVNLFISYSSAFRDLCERLRLALEAEGHSVWVDRAELKEGEPYHAALREGIASADAIIFLVSPQSVAPGSYALTELDLAQRRWRRPAGHVLPVVVAPTPIGDIPAYLRTLTLLQPRGDMVGETVAAVARLRPNRTALWVGLALAAVLLLGIGGYGLHLQQARETARVEALQREEARVAALQRELGVAAQLCSVGSHAVAWEQFAQIAARHADDPAVRVPREDCGMLWLRDMRVVSEKETFGELVGKVQPVLAQGLAAASGVRAADLRAHLGWADFLRSRDGVSAPNPVPQYQAALLDDPGNPYAHAMWAHNLVWTQRSSEAQARQHFDAAVAGQRARPYVRNLQFAAALIRRDMTPYAVVVLNDMRLKGETVERERAERLWRYVYDGPFLQPNERPDYLAAVAPVEHLATFEWLYPVANMREEWQLLWHYVHATLQARAGQINEARAILEAVQRAQRAARDDSRLSRAVDTELAQWRRPGR